MTQHFPAGRTLCYQIKGLQSLSMVAFGMVVRNMEQLQSTIANGGRPRSRTTRNAMCAKPANFAASAGPSIKSGSTKTQALHCGDFVAEIERQAFEVSRLEPLGFITGNKYESSNFIGTRPSCNSSVTGTELISSFQLYTSRSEGNRRISVFQPL